MEGMRYDHEGGGSFERGILLRMRRRRFRGFAYDRRGDDVPVVVVHVNVDSLLR